MVSNIQDKISQAQKFRIKSDIQIKFENLALLIEKRAEEAPNAIYLIGYDIKGYRTEITYGDFFKRVRQGASLLSSLGIKQGDRVATFASNHIETVIASFSVFYLGACLVPINMTEDSSRQSFILENSEACIALALEEYTQIALDLSKKIPAIKVVVQLNGESIPGSIDWITDKTNLIELNSISGEDEALIVYTSGTTGAPKGVVLTQSNLLADAHTIAEWNHFEKEDRLMCVLPIHHVNGLVVTLITPLYFGGSVVLNSKFSTEHFWNRIELEKVKCVSVVPTLLAFLLERAELFKLSNVSCLSHFICGAGPLTVELGKMFEETFKIKILHGYGLSETTCYSSMLPLQLSTDEHNSWMRNFGFPSIGLSMFGCEMTVLDEKGKVLPPHQRGEIVICGPTVMKGYFKRDDSNETAFIDGWFHSGDEGFYELDDNNQAFFFITGRLKELIIRGGVNLSPLEIDEVLTSIKGVQCGLAVGFENFWYGEEVGAYIVLQEEFSIDAVTIISEARKHLPFSKSPKVVVFGKEIPVTSTGKYRRNFLKPLFEKFKQEQFRE